MGTAILDPTANAEPWPPREPLEPLAVLVSGGADSAVLTAEAARVYPAVFPLYVRTGLYWEETELAYLARFLEAIRSRALQPLTILEQPVRDLYGPHWSITGENVPGAGSADEEVFLPGRNVLLLAKSLLWCHLHRVPELALAPLGLNPFADATPEFFQSYSGAVNRAMSGSVRVLRPYASLNKQELLRRGQSFPLEHTFSCVRPERGQHCGRCNKCHERRTGFRAAGLADPTAYLA